MKIALGHVVVLETFLPKKGNFACFLIRQTRKASKSVRKPVKGKGTGQEPSRDEILSGTGTEILILARKNCGTGTEIQILARDKSGTGTDRNIDCPALFNH